MERKAGAQGPQGVTRRVLIAMLLAVLSVGGFLGATPSAQQGVDGVQVKFRQLNWRGAGKSIRVPNSRVATAVFSFDRAAAGQLVGKGGYVNLVIQVPGKSGRQWVVQNLRLRYKDERFLLGSHPSVQFPLPTPNGFRVDQLRYALTVTPAPLAAPPAARLAAAGVEAKPYKVGGLHNGGSERATSLIARVRPFVGHRPLRFDPIEGGGIGVEPATDIEGSTLVPAGELPVINEDPNGCAPAGVARSIQYMTDHQGVLLDGSAQDIYNDLWDNMGTTEENGTATGQDIADGKAQFAGDNGLDIDTQLQENGVGSAGEAIDVLNGGGDVEILINWNGGGGHVGMISSIVENDDGTYTITYVDDPDQEDGVAENEEVVIIVDANGDILEGGDGSIDGLLIETLHSDSAGGGPVLGGDTIHGTGGH